MDDIQKYEDLRSKLDLFLNVGDQLADYLNDMNEVVLYNQMNQALDAINVIYNEVDDEVYYNYQEISNDQEDTSINEGE